MSRILLSCLTVAAGLSAMAQTSPAPGAPAGHDHAMMIPGVKTELFAGITEADLLKLGDTPNTAKVTLVATFNSANAGMNFNGYSHGRAVLTVPKDWQVQVTFINPSPIPHSALVIEKQDTKKLQVTEPYFPGGATPKHLIGLTTAKADFSFKADEAGEFALACGFPAHAVSGHWLALNVSAEAKTPTLQLGDQPAKEVTR